MYSALLIGYFDGKGFLRFYTEIQNSRCDFVLEKGFWRVDKLFYFYYPVPVAHSMIYSRDGSESKDNNHGGIMTEDENYDIEKKKNKYEEVNVEDFISR